jgi:ZIP family zinc transporter
MAADLAVVVAIAGVAGVASVAGGLLALRHRTSTLISSVGFGIASGALVGSVTLEMLPAALELGTLPTVVCGFAVGTIALYAFDLSVHGGFIVGERADQRRIVRRYHRRRRSESQVLVLAGGTSLEELVEGLAIGVGAAVEPSLALVVAAAIAVDNLAEGMSVGELIRVEEHDARRTLSRIVRWTGTIGIALFGSSVIGWLALRGLSGTALAGLLAGGAGAMLYLTLSSLVPEGEAREYQRSATLAAAAAFALILVLSSLRT